MSVHNQAYVTLVTSDEYVLGALVLAHSLRQTGTQRQLVCMATQNVPVELRGLLNGVFDRVVEVDIFNSSDVANLKLLGRPELGCTFTKLHCWRLTEYSKCIFLDADMLVLSNVDELFERDELTACRDAGWPDYFNSGLFVFVPNANTYAALVEFAVSHGSFDGGDQGLLNRFFIDWGFADMRKHLPFIFNCTAVYLNATYSYLPAVMENISKIRVLHFAGAANKPWLFRYEVQSDDIIVPGSDMYAMFARYWWHLLASQVHRSLVDAVHPNSAHVNELVRRIAAIPFHEHSKLMVSARLHPNVALVATPQAHSAAAAMPTATTVPTVSAPASSIPQQQPQQSQQQQGPLGPRSFSDIERKLRESLN